VGWDVMVVDVDRVDIIVLRGRVVVRLMAGEFCLLVCVIICIHYI
jgi:hypothetical protein